jgi:aminoglycoside phosphotransferase family enzyme/predicted kinase
VTTREAPAAGAAINETHISTVAFVGDRAFKFLKPIRTPFLDQSTLAARRVAVERELWLNRRMAPDVYLGVGEVREDDEVTDVFLVMRRLPAARRLSTLVAGPDDQLAADAIREVARRIAEFHARQPSPPLAEEVATRDAEAARWAQNLEELQAFAGRHLAIDALARVEGLSWRFLAGRDELFAERIRRGFARDGHGDLLADDIFVLDDGVRILDCLAFDDALRCGDVLADVAFLAMDLERVAGLAPAEALWRWYTEFSDEHHPAALAHLYVAYRALVRAKVSCLRADQGDAAAGEAARVFLDQTERHLRAALPAVVLVGGGPGVGKSTVATAIGEAEAMVVLSSDELRKDLAGVAHGDHAFAPPGEGIYRAEMTERVYDELLARAEALVRRGESVVLDATWGRAAPRAAARAMAEAAHADLVEMRCVLDPSVARERIARRLATMYDPSDATPDIADALNASFEAWPEAVALETGRLPDEVRREAVDAYRRERSINSRG